MKFILHIFIVFLLANTFAVSMIEDYLDEECTEISMEEGEDDSEEENSDDKTDLNLDMISATFNVSFGKSSTRIFMDLCENYSYLFTNTPFSPPKMNV